MASLSLVKNTRWIFGPSEAGDHRRRRLLSLVQSSITSLGNRMLGVVVSFVSVPLTIGYLGREQYGAWVTIGSMLAWLTLSDLGLGNGLQNAVTTAVGEERPDLVRMHLSNGLLALSCIAGVVGLVAAIAWPFIDWSALFGLSSPAARAEISPAIGIALACFLLSFPLGMAGKVYLAYGEGRIGNYWGAAGNLLSLAVLLVVTRTHGGLVSLVLAYSGTSVLMNVASNLWVFLHRRPAVAPRLRYVDRTALKQLSRVGGKFFLIGIMALVTFQTDNIVISHFLGAGQVPPYSLTYSLFSYTALPQSILFSYLWAAYTEAIARKDIAWVRRAFALNLGLGMVFTALAVIGLIVIARPFIAWWAGAGVVPGYHLIFWIAAWSLINAFTNPIACLLAAASHLKAQLTYSALATVSNIGLSIFLALRWGIDGVIAATVLSYAVFVCGPIFIDARLLLRKLSRAV